MSRDGWSCQQSRRAILTDCRLFRVVRRKIENMANQVFCKKNPDKKELQHQIEALMGANDVDCDEQLQQVRSQVEEIESIDVHNDVQKLQSVFTQGSAVF